MGRGCIVSGDRLTKGSGDYNTLFPVRPQVDCECRILYAEERFFRNI